MLLYPDIFNYLMFLSSKLGSKDFNNCKNSKTNHYHKSHCLQPLYHILTRRFFRILTAECTKSLSAKSPLHKLWIILALVLQNFLKKMKNLDKSIIQFSLQKISWAFQWCTLFINFYLLGKRRHMQRSKIKFFLKGG